MEGEFGKDVQGEQKERNATFEVLCVCVCSRARESCHLDSRSGDVPFKNKGRVVR